MWGAGAMDLCAARPSWPRWPPRRVNRRPPRRPRLRSRVCGKRSRVPRCFRWVGDLACGSHRPPCLWGSATRPPDRQAGTPAATPTRGTQCPPTRNCRGTRACLSPDLPTQNSEEPQFSDRAHASVAASTGSDFSPSRGGATYLLSGAARSATMPACSSNAASDAKTAKFIGRGPWSSTTAHQRPVCKLVRCAGEFPAERIFQSSHRC